MFKNKYLPQSIAALGMLGTADATLAQDAAAYLSRTIRYIVGDTPGQYTAFIKTELVKWGEAVKASGAKVE